MRIPVRQRWLLRRMDRRLCRSDPHLAAMLAIFARLNVREAITSREQAHPDGCLRRSLAGLRRAIISAVACLAVFSRRAFRQIVSTGATACRWLTGRARSPLKARSAPRPRPDRGSPGLPTN